MVISAVVMKVVKVKFPYVVCLGEINGQKQSITFSLKQNIWKYYPNEPSGGAEVILEEVFCKNNKWRANKARYYNPSDETAPAVIVE